MTTQEYQQRSEAIKVLIIELLFKQNKSYITEVTIKYQVPCYNVNIKRVVYDINKEGIYSLISYKVNSYGVLVLFV